jgi:hypothetical protein
MLAFSSQVGMKRLFLLSVCTALQGSIAWSKQGVWSYVNRTNGTPGC